MTRKYRKRPVVIDAEQWFPGNSVAGVCLGGESCRQRSILYPAVLLDGRPHVHTLEGWHEVSPGDWIITGVKGEKYPCKPDVFAATYEPADGDTVLKSYLPDSGVADHAWCSHPSCHICRSGGSHGR